MFTVYDKSTCDFIFETTKETFILNARNNTDKLTLSSDQIYSLRNNYAHLIIFNDYEPTNFYHFKQKFLNLLHYIPPQNVVIVSSNLFYTLNPHSLKKDFCPYRVFYFNDFFNLMTEKHIPDNRSFKVKNHFTCLSGVDKYFRRYFYYLLKINNLINYGFVSHNRFENYTDDRDIYFENKIKDSVTSFDIFKQISNEKLIIDKSYADFFNSTPHKKLRGLNDDMMMWDNSDFSKHSGIEVVLESAIKGCNFISEKTIKAILNKNIFLLVGGFQTLVFLRKLGFKTFDHIVDESYDLIRCDFTRVNSTFAQLKKFCTLSLDEVEKIKNDNQELLDYNYNHLLYNLDTTFNLKNKVESYLNKGENYGRN